jgi:hypothetical protein
MWLDVFLVAHPAQELSSTIGRISNQLFGSHFEALLEPFDHGPGGLYFQCPIGRCGFHIDNDTGVGVDQIVGRVSIKGRAACA